MSAQELRDLLERVDDTREIVLRRGDEPAPAELLVVWREARSEATTALEQWRSRPGPDTYSAYRAAEDRADAAQDSLAGTSVAVRSEG
jgi:hypothetical protein